MITSFNINISIYSDQKNRQTSFSDEKLIEFCDSRFQISYKFIHGFERFYPFLSGFYVIEFNYLKAKII